MAQAPMAAVPAKDSAVPFVASLLFTSILLLLPDASIPGLGRVRLALLAGVFAVAAHCWSRLAAGRPWRRVLDLLHRPIAHIDALGYRNSVVYNVWHQVVQHKDEIGAIVMTLRFEHTGHDSCGVLHVDEHLKERRGRHPAHALRNAARPSLRCAEP